MSKQNKKGQALYSVGFHWRSVTFTDLAPNLTIKPDMMPKKTAV